MIFWSLLLLLLLLLLFYLLEFVPSAQCNGE